MGFFVKTNTLFCWLARLFLVGIMISGMRSAGAMDIPVANNADSDNSTLRQAIQLNESLGGGNTVVFSNIVTGTITLTNVLGELLITKFNVTNGPTVGYKFYRLKNN
jgi:hypothetical protein